MIGLSLSAVAEHAKLNRDKLLYAAMYSVILEVRNWLLNGQELRNKKKKPPQYRHGFFKILFDLRLRKKRSDQW